MDDWEHLVADVPWFPAPHAIVEVGRSEPWNRGVIENLPAFSALLEAAAVTAVLVDGTPYEVLGWGSSASRHGWIGPSASAADTTTPAVHPLHRAIWAVTGGITEIFGEPPSWWENQEEVLTPGAASTDLAAYFSAASWVWEDDGLHLPIDPNDYYAAAVEANGNLTLVHRQNGAVILFALDHDFEGVTPLAGCPPLSLMTIDASPTLTDWVESCAREWWDG